MAFVVDTKLWLDLVSTDDTGEGVVGRQPQMFVHEEKGRKKKGDGVASQGLVEGIRFKGEGGKERLLLVQQDRKFVGSREAVTGATCGKKAVWPRFHLLHKYLPGRCRESSRKQTY